MKWMHERLEEAIKHKGLTKEQFADEIKVSRPTLHSWLNGSVPKGIHLMKIADYFGVRISQFFDEVTEVRTTLPLYHKIGSSASTDEMKATTKILTDLYKDLFAHDSENPLQEVVISRDPKTASFVADAFRKMMGVEAGKAPSLKDVLSLMRLLRVTVIPRSFPENINADAFYVLMGCAKVIFINRNQTCDALASALIHEVVHSLRASLNEELTSDELDREEEYCDRIAEATMRGEHEPNIKMLDDVLFGARESIGFIDKLETYFPLWYDKVKILASQATVSRLAEILDISEDDARDVARNLESRGSELG